MNTLVQVYTKVVFNGRINGPATEEVHTSLCVHCNING